MTTALVTSGGTSEPIDQVRKIQNSSSGKLGCHIAQELISSDHIDHVIYIAQKNAYRPDPHPKLTYIEIVTSQDVADIVQTLLTHETIDYFIHSMAIADYTTEGVWTEQAVYNKIQGFDAQPLGGEKISSSQEGLYIKLKPTPKIIKMIKEIQDTTFLVGFKLLVDVSETVLIDTAHKLLVKNNCDLVIANDLRDIRAGNHTAYFVSPDKNYSAIDGKGAIAKNIVNALPIPTS